jgi:hypothetical protein
MSEGGQAGGVGTSRRGDRNPLCAATGCCTRVVALPDQLGNRPHRQRNSSGRIGKGQHPKSQHSARPRACRGARLVWIVGKCWGFRGAVDRHRMDEPMTAHVVRESIDRPSSPVAVRPVGVRSCRCPMWRVCSSDCDFGRTGIEDAPVRGWTDSTASVLDIVQAVHPLPTPRQDRNSYDTA